MNEKELFADGLDESWTNILAKRNIITPTKIQKLVIPRLIQKESIVFCSATGTGKTIAYLLPLLQYLKDAVNNGESGLPYCYVRALILSPTIELCVQIKNEFDFFAKEFLPQTRAALLISGVSIKKQKTALKQEKPSVIIGSTQRIIELAGACALKLSGVQWLVLDEADRLVSTEQLDLTKKLLSMLPVQRINTGCSATFSTGAKVKLAALPGIDDPAFIETDGHEIIRNFITHWALWTENRRKISTLRSLLTALNTKKILVFTEMAYSACKICEQLRYHKIKAGSLYSGQKKNERARVLDSFKQGGIDILVSTDLAARGLDIQNLNYVICVGVNESSEIYIHRAGRTARCGKKGVCISIGNETELRHLLAIEKKLRIIIYPKILESGRICSPEEEYNTLNKS
ncbi:MAG: DEAD/DEAH box helicase [Spirochaetaceae bacterium]|jgi:superfamily II DNA/RNA helicase|nr:DEAD/DEAH box helicase [Spirochaetaceae bacterium]